MTDFSLQETFSRLEQMQGAGRFDLAKRAVENGSPILEELGFSASEALQALETPLNKLEALPNMSSGGLEAIVNATSRPPLLVRNNRVIGKTKLTGLFDASIDLLINGVEPLLASVGRIEFINHDKSWGGTGWVIGEDGPEHLLIVTNRHVAKIVARRSFRGSGVFMFSRGNVPYGAQIDFMEEAGSIPDPARVLKLESFTYLADDAAADVALARVKNPNLTNIEPLPLAPKDGEDKELVAVVGYPAADSQRNNVFEMERYFQGVYNVKRFSPGELRAQDGPTILTHDCTTLGGNSGSPVISLVQKAVVGLHFSGLYGVENSAVRVSTLKKLLDTGATGSTHPVAGVVRESRDGKHDVDHFNGRDGFDSMFLQAAPAPLPVISAGLGLDLATPSDATESRPHELRYQHFSILYSQSRKSPVIAALNIDGTKTKAIKRSNSRWYKDLRIPADTQLGQPEYGDPVIDRGHMVRRAATNWGDTVEIAKRANLDSYHYTVASPQHLGLNRNTNTWLGLENYIMTNARTFGFKASVFTGPIFKDSDPELGQTGTGIPMAYFKVVCMLAEEVGEQGALRLHATAYVLSQGQLIQALLADQGNVESAEGFAFGAFRTFQIRIRDLEAQTGYDFGHMRIADPLENFVEGIGGKTVIALNRLEELVL